MPTFTLKGNNTGATAAPLDLTAAQTMTMLGAAPLASPTFTGTPSLPTGTIGVTQATATNNTSLATTAFVKAQGYGTGNGSVTSVTAGTGLTGGTITGTGTFALSVPVSIANGGSGATTAGGAPWLPLTGGIVSGNGIGYSGVPAGETGHTISFGWNGASLIAHVDGTNNPGGLLPLSGGTLSGALTVNGALATTGALTTAAPGVVIGSGFSIYGPTPTISFAANNYIQFNSPNLVFNVASGSHLFVQTVQPNVNNNLWCGLPTANGNAWYGVGAYNFATQSDIKYKADIAELPACLDFVRNLVPKRYLLTDGPPEDDGIVHWGFVAQDVGETFKEHNFGGHRIDTGENGTNQSVQYNELVAVLWKAVQELSARIEALEARLA
jgi:hypothetical protein